MNDSIRRDDLEGWVDRQDRRTVDFSAFLQQPNGSRRSVLITNLSYEGCEINGATVDIGDVVTLDLIGLGKVHAQVRWTAGDKTGARFVDG